MKFFEYNLLAQFYSIVLRQQQKAKKGKKKLLSFPNRKGDEAAYESCSICEEFNMVPP